MTALVPSPNPQPSPSRRAVSCCAAVHFLSSRSNANFEKPTLPVSLLLPPRPPLAPVLLLVRELPPPVLPPSPRQRPRPHPRHPRLPSTIILGSFLFPYLIDHQNIRPATGTSTKPSASAAASSTPSSAATLHNGKVGIAAGVGAALFALLA